MKSRSSVFSDVAHWTAQQSGRASTFLLACLLVIIWGITGPFFNFSDTWQLVINTGTTIVTFLMVFLLQHAQNRDSTAIQLKLDELIRVSRDARNKVLTLEDLTEAELEHIKGAFTKLASQGEAQADLDDASKDLRQAREGIDEAENAIARASVKQAAE
jgi:low affinity Fe/Cu permease